MPTATAGTVQCDDVGRGHPVLLVHGVAFGPASFAGTAEALLGHARVIVVHRRGYGRTAARAGGGRPEDDAADILDLLDRLEIERASAVGVGDGATILTAFAMAAVAPGQAEDAGGHGEQGKDADNAESRKKGKDVAGGMVAADIDEAGGGADQKQRHQEHEADRAAARHALALVESGPSPPFAAFGVALPCPVLACHDASCDLLSPRRELPTLSASPGPRRARASPRRPLDKRFRRQRAATARRSRMT